ncbi:hypothetical protein [Pseudomonas sp. S2_H01]
MNDERQVRVKLTGEEQALKARALDQIASRSHSPTVRGRNEAARGVDRPARQAFEEAIG